MGVTEVSNRNLSPAEAYVIRQLLHMQPKEFWRACKGRTLIELPENPGELDRRVLAGMKENPRRLLGQGP